MMKKISSTFRTGRFVRIGICFLIVLLASIYIYPQMYRKAPKVQAEKPEANENLFEPYDFLFHQRSYPDSAMDIAAYLSVMHQVSNQVHSNASARVASTGSWTLEGPANIGGRINCAVSDPGNPSVMYVACAAGGIFKTVNGGL